LRLAKCLTFPEFIWLYPKTTHVNIFTMEPKSVSSLIEI
jgi:hypothetical protein